MARVVMPVGIQPQSELRLAWTEHGLDIIEVVTTYTPVLKLRPDDD